MFRLLTKARAQNDLQERYIANIYSAEYHVWNITTAANWSIGSTTCCTITEKALVGASSVIVQPVVEQMDRFAALVILPTFIELNIMYGI